MEKKNDKGYPYRDRKILLIDLSNDEYRFIQLSQDICKNYHGGRALAYKLWDDYADLTSINKECLYVGAPIIISLGASSDLENENIIGSTILTYSLSLNSIVSSNFNSIKFVKSLAALDISAIVIKGRARRLSKIEIFNNIINIELCENLHNINTFEISQEFDNASSLISIGKSGESRLDYSSINIDNINVGRFGFGASFGEKNIKLVAFFVKNSNYRNSYYEKEYKEVSSFFNEKSDVNYLEYANKFGWAAIEGFKYRYDPRLWGLGGELVKDCKNDWLINLALGANLGIYDCKKTQMIQKYCLDYALDPFSFSVYLLWLFNADEENIIDLKVDKNLPKFEKILYIIEFLCDNKSSFSEINENVSKLGEKFNHRKYDFSVYNKEILPFDLRGMSGFSLSLIYDDDTFVPWEMFKKFNKRNSSSALFHSQIYREICESLGVSWKEVLFLVNHNCSFRNNNNKFLKILTKLFSVCEGYKISEEDLLNFGKRSLFYRKEVESKINDNINFSTKNIPSYFFTNSKSNFKEKNVLSIAEEVEKYSILFEHEKEKLGIKI